MRSTLKIAVSLFATLAVANVMAICGPRGCGYQGGYQSGYPQSNYQGGYSQPNYQGGYYQPNYQEGYGYQGGYDHFGPAYSDGYSSGPAYHGGGGGFSGNLDDHYIMGGGHEQGHPAQGYYDQNHDGHGYDQPRPDHPVQDANGQHIKYYGKPGPDYNQQNLNQQGGGAWQNQGNQQYLNQQGGGAQQFQEAPIQSQAGAATSYNYNGGYDWDRLADAGSTKGATGAQPVQPNKGSTGAPSKW